MEVEASRTKCLNRQGGARRARTEIAIETVYNFALDDEDQTLTAGSFVRFNPDHDPNADPDLGIGLTYKLKF